MKGLGPKARDYLLAVERNLLAARNEDERTGAALARYARVLVERAHDALLAERGGLQPSPIA